MSIDLTKIKRIRTTDGREWNAWVHDVLDSGRGLVISGFGVFPKSLGGTWFSESAVISLIEHGCFTPVAEPTEIPLDNWEPEEGDIVEWANGYKGTVFVGPLDTNQVPLPDGSMWTTWDAREIIQAAKCKIWRNQ